jgi:hypothetical protein
MLYIDRDFVTSTDVNAIEPEASKIVTAHSLSYPAIMARAHSECGRTLESNMMAFGAGGDVSGNHLAAVLNTGSATIGRRARLGQVIVNSIRPGYDSTIHLWVLYSALRLLYQAAFSSKAVDRYEKKLQHYDKLAKSHWAELASIGVPVVSTPLPCPGAVHEPDAGVFNQDTLSESSGPGASGGAFHVAITYTATGYTSPTDKGNAESAISAVAFVTITAGQVLKVDISGLTPPTGSIQAGVTDTWLNMAATGWNVYVGTEPTKLYLQNSSPVAIATTSYTLAADPVLSGTKPDNGQRYDTKIRPVRYIQRA